MQEQEFDIEVASEIPDEVMAWFEGRSAMLIHPRDYKPRNFTGFYVTHHLSGDLTFAARQTKRYSATDGTVEDLIHLIGVDENYQERGHGEIRRNISHDDPYFKDKPFVGMTSTESGIRHQGLGTRRLFLMNQLSLMLFGLVLHSSTTFAHEDAKKIWERLVSEGYALKYEEDGNYRYKFTLPKN